MARKKRYRRLDDFQKWKIEQLGKFGGFSHRYIASIVFDKTLARITDNEVAAVSHVLHTLRVKVTDWRNGITPQAAQYAKDKTKATKKRLKLLKAA